MRTHKDQLVFEQSIGFFGAVTASLSHEMNNVMAIINELSGLMDDFLVTADDNQPPDPKRQREILERVSAQVQRGIGYVRQLNSFAHSADDPNEILDARESFEEIAALCQRFAKLKQVTLKSTSPKQTLRFKGSSFMLQQIIFRSIEIALMTSGQGDSLSVDLEDEGDGVRITVKNQRPFEATSDVSGKISSLEQIASTLGGKLEAPILPDKPLDLALYLPNSVEEDESDNTG